MSAVGLSKLPPRSHINPASLYGVIWYHESLFIRLAPLHEELLVMLSPL